MILFRPPPHDAAGGSGHSYALRMAASLTALGHPAALTSQPAKPGDIAVIDGLALPGPVDDPGATLALMHHAVSRPAAGLAGPAPDRAAHEAALRQSLVGLRRVVCTSAGTADALRTRFGLDCAIVAPGADRLPRAEPRPGPLAVLSPGVLTRRKGHDVLIKALAGLMDLDWTLTIAGHGGRDRAFERALQDEADALLGRVTILHDPDGPALDALFHRAGLVVVLTRWEGFPAAAAQALGRGIALVSTEAGLAGLPERAGLVVSTDEGATLAKVLRRAIADAGLRAQLAAASATAGAALPSWRTQAALFASALV